MRLRSLLTPVAAAVAIVTATGAPASPAVPATLEAAEEAYRSYDFDLAESIIDKLTAPVRRKKGSEPAVSTEAAEALRDRIVLARDMMARVENVTVLDSMTVGRDDFFKAFRLAGPTGSLADEEPVERALGRGSSLRVVAPAYITEDGSGMLFTAYDSEDPDETFAVYELSRLADGSWEQPRRLFTRNSLFATDSDTPGEVYSPFQMADGVTVYFSADGPASLGGLDIFMARRDGDGFLQPANVGMPYNSPANDYMMAIDEVTGLGWWVTDRGTTDSETVRIFIFAPAELRVNYPADTPGLTAIALLENIPGIDAGEVTRRLSAITSTGSSTPASHEIAVAMPDGRVISHIGDLRSRDARDLAADLVEARNDLAAASGRLMKLREIYRNGDRSVSGDILDSEIRIERRRDMVAKLINEIVRAETAYSGTR